MTHRGHPVEPPVPGHPAQAADHAVEGLDQVWLVLGLGQHPPPPARVRQRPDQQMRRTGQAPPDGRVGQLQPVELSLLPGRMVDDRHVPVRTARARRTPWTQPPHPQRPGERRVRTRVAQLAHLVEQRGRPHVPVIGQPLGDVGGERLEHLRRRPPPHPRGALPGQVRPDGLGVPTQMPGDHSDLPTPLEQRLGFQLFLPCEHVTGSLRRLLPGSRSLEGTPWRRPATRRSAAPRVGNFSEQVQGTSVSVVNVHHGIDR